MEKKVALVTGASRGIGKTDQSHSGKRRNVCSCQLLRIGSEGKECAGRNPEKWWRRRSLSV